MGKVGESVKILLDIDKVLVGALGAHDLEQALEMMRNTRNNRQQLHRVRWQ